MIGWMILKKQGLGSTWNHWAAKTEKTCRENLRKYACFTIEPLWKNFAKTLQKPCKKLRLSQYFTKFHSFCTPTTGSVKTVENPRNAMLLACFSANFRRTFARRFCCKMYNISQINFRTFPLFSQLLATPVFANPCYSILSDLVTSHLVTFT